MGTRPGQYNNAFLREGCSISANLMSARRAFSMRFHTPFVRLPAERARMVTVRALLNKYGFEMSLFFFYLFEFK